MNSFIQVFITGFIIGIAYVAPIGLQNLFVINSALTQSKKKAYLTAFIVVFFDVTLACAAFFGIGLLLEKLAVVQLAVLLTGSLIVLYIGVGLLRSALPSDMEKDMSMPVTKVITSACVVTWFNPQAIIDGTMLLGASKATLPAGGDILFIAGVCGASVFWFFAVTTFILLFSNKMTPVLLLWINRICGAVMILYAGKLLYEFVRMLIAVIFVLG